MKIIFAGTPEFAAVALAALIAAGHEIALVLTRPDRPAGRGMKPQASAVKALALGRLLPVLQPGTLKSEVIHGVLQRAGAEAMVVAAYGLILPGAVLAIPRRGCINIHASLLPRWRGAAPIQRALLAGDTETGITIVQMDEGLDTGPILLQQRIAIGAADTAQTLHDRLARLGARLIVRALAENPQPRPQDEARATYAEKVAKREADIDWREPATAIERRVRAFNPYPVVQSRIKNTTVKIWGAQVGRRAAAAPGAIMEIAPRGVLVACGQDGLWLTELQRPGGRRMAAAAFLAGFPLAPGERFGD